MPQSLTKVYLHIIFSTKYRQKLLTEDVQPELFSYLGGICNNLEYYPLKIGGYLNHIHILSSLSKKIALMKFIQELKTGSSKWIKTKGPAFENFHWQNGYGAFSVNLMQTGRVIQYINDQKAHHQKQTFQDEYRDYLTKYKVDYDERYVWD